MAQLIKNKSVIDDEWTIAEKDSHYPEADINAGARLLLPLSLWLDNAEKHTGRSTVGLWLDSDDTTDAIENNCKDIPIIAINFPNFADGRGYSLARQLREKLGYEGELRAIGDILMDQLFFYERVGFSSFSVRQDRPAAQAVEGLDQFSVVYQAAADNRTPGHNKR